MSEVRIDQRFESGVSVCRIEGWLDGPGSAVAETYPQQRISAGEPRLVLDLAGVASISSAGLRCLMVLAKKAQSANGRLGLFCLAPMVLDVMKVSGFHQLLRICVTEEEAVAAAVSAPQWADLIVT